MTNDEKKIPSKHGEFYFDPPFSFWKEEALRNRERTVKESPWGQSASKVREALKMPTDQPIVMSGHQPVFFHPGLWAKCLAASSLAEAVQGTVYHKLTDTAVSAEYSHFLPEVEDNGKARRKKLEFFSNHDLQTQEKTTPYAFLPPPDYEAMDKIYADAQVFCPKSIKENMRIFEPQLLNGLKESESWNGYHINYLKMLDGICGTERQFLEGSRIWASEPFFEFLTFWMANLPELTGVYNESLDDYRRKYKIKHKLNPMPNLGFEDWWFEIPFWGITQYHQRHSLMAKNDGKHIVLKLRGTTGTYSAGLTTLQNDLATLPILIWPKAIPQTLFCRLYLCDFFIHGMGGGWYEEVNDLIFKKALKIKPLAYGVVSATYLVEPEESQPLEIITDHEKNLEKWERILEKNPEYLFTRQDSWIKELPVFMHMVFKKCLENGKLEKLAEEKKKWVNLLSDPAQRTEASQKIRAINDELYDECIEAAKILEMGILDVARVKEVKDVLSFREYPFFCFPKEIFTNMKDIVRQEVDRA